VVRSLEPARLDFKILFVLPKKAVPRNPSKVGNDLSAKFIFGQNKSSFFKMAFSLFLDKKWSKNLGLILKSNLSTKSKVILAAQARLTLSSLIVSFAEIITLLYTTLHHKGCLHHQPAPSFWDK
jgi:hypothetical protein